MNKRRGLAASGRQTSIRRLERELSTSNMLHRDGSSSSLLKAQNSWQFRRKSSSSAASGRSSRTAPATVGGSSIATVRDSVSDVSERSSAMFPLAATAAAAASAAARTSAIIEAGGLVDETQKKKRSSSSHRLSARRQSRISDFRKSRIQDFRKRQSSIVGSQQSDWANMTQKRHSSSYHLNALCRPILHTNHHKYSPSSPHQQRRKMGGGGGGDFTIDKLRFNELGVYGRDDEIGQLRACLERMMERLAQGRPSRGTICCDVHVNDQEASGQFELEGSLWDVFAMAEEEDAIEEASEAFACVQRNQDGSTEEKWSDERDPNEQEEQGRCSVSTLTGPTTLPCNERQLVLISGYAGTGKTLLASTIAPHIEKLGGALVAGKFDSDLKDVPYTGIAAACGQLVKMVKALLEDEKRYQYAVEILDDITDDLGNDCHVLEKVIPELKQFVGEVNLDIPVDYIDEDTKDEDPIFRDLIRSSMAGSGSKDYSSPDIGDPGSFKYVTAQHRLGTAFRRLIRAFSSYFAPLVIVLDDLQYADAASLTLLEGLISDRDNKDGLMIIGCYRSNEVDGSWRNTQEAAQVQLSSILTDLRKKGAVAEVYMEDHDGSELERTMRKRKQRLEAAFEITELQLGNLKVNEVNAMVMDLLGMDDVSRTMGLAEVSHMKTNGNPFFLIHFLSRLTESKLLEYCFGLMSWKWDLQEIRNETLATLNVVDLMKQQMEMLPTNVSRALHMAACLGTTFGRRSIEIVWAEDATRKFGDTESGDVLDDVLMLLPVTLSSGEVSTQSDAGVAINECATKVMESLLRTLVEDGYLYPLADDLAKSANCGTIANARASKCATQEQSSDKLQYRWVHHQIREAALLLVPDAERNRLKGRIGAILYSRFSVEELEANVFAVANLLNSVDIPTDIDRYVPHRMQLSRLNLRAAQKALGLSAFGSAAKYASRAVALLPSGSCWEDDHYDFTIDLYSTAAETEGYLGRIHQMKEHSSQVVQHARKNWSDKLRVYHVLLDCMYVRGDLHEATNLCLEVLWQLGCRFPQNRASILLHTRLGLANLRGTLKRRTMEEGTNLALMTDTRRVEILKLLDKFITYAYFTGHELLPLAVCKEVQISLTYGLSMASPPALAMAGAILAGTAQDFAGALVYGQTALTALHNLNQKLGEHHRNIEARTLLLTYGFVFPWCKPVSICLKPLLRAYILGMQNCDTDSAFWAIVHYIVLAFQSGRPLSALERDCREYSEQGMGLQRDQQVGYLSLLWQTFLNLAGDNKNTVTLTGKIMDEEYCLRLATEMQNPVLVGWLQALRSLLFAFFGEHTEGAKLAIEKGDRLAEMAPGSPHVAVDAFYRGISLFDVARRTKQGKFKRQAKKAASTVKAWVKSGNPNVHHLDMLLDAEMAALNGQHMIAMTKYEAAVVFAARGGFVQHAALSNERYGEFLLAEMKNSPEAAFRFDEACRFYSEWNAHAKVQLIRNKHAHLWI